MKTATEIAKLHSLFLSQDPANWALAAMMCSEGEFDKVVEMEVERIKSIDSDINTDYPSIIGTQFCWLLGWGYADLDGHIFDFFDVSADLKDVDLKPVTNRWRNQLKDLKSAVA